MYIYRMKDVEVPTTQNDGKASRKRLRDENNSERKTTSAKKIPW
jgi:hypothetical protein